MRAARIRPLRRPAAATSPWRGRTEDMIAIGRQLPVRLAVHVG